MPIVFLYIDSARTLTSLASLPPQWQARACTAAPPLARLSTRNPRARSTAAGSAWCCRPSRTASCWGPCAGESGVSLPNGANVRTCVKVYTRFFFVTYTDTWLLAHLSSVSIAARQWAARSLMLSPHTARAALAVDALHTQPALSTEHTRTSAPCSSCSGSLHRAVRPGRPYVSALRQGVGWGWARRPELPTHRLINTAALSRKRGVGLSLCASMSVLRARAL